jgi:hypothetical protein
LAKSQASHILNVMRNEIVILEDNGERRERMLACLRKRLPPFPVHFFTTAQETIRYLNDHPQSVQLVDLDHDLEPRTAGDPDPGTGRDVSNSLVKQAPYCPVIIHSTNHDASVAMEAELQEAGWQVQRVVPYDDLAWIEREWFAAVREGLLARAKKPAASSTARATISADTLRAAQALITQAGGIAEARAALEHLASQSESQAK